MRGQQCSGPECILPASVLIAEVPYCTGDGRAANGGRL